MTDRIIAAALASLLLLICLALRILPERVLTLIVRVAGLIALAIITVSVNYSAYRDDKASREGKTP